MIVEELEEVDSSVSIKPRIINTVKANKSKGIGNKVQLAPLYEDDEIENLRSIDKSRDNIFQ